jgi:hypothetical protein
MTIRLAPHAPVLIAVSCAIIALRLVWPVAQRVLAARAAARELEARRRAWEPSHG